MDVFSKDSVGLKSLMGLTTQELNDRDAVLQLYDVVADAPVSSTQPLNGISARAKDTDLPNVAKAEGLARHAHHLAQLQNGLVAAINRLSLGVCILNQACNVIDMNQEFERQLQTYDAFRLGPTGKLDFASGSDRSGLASLMIGDNQSRLHKEVVPVVDGAETRALCIDVEALRSADENGEEYFDGAIIYSMDTSLMSEVDVDPLAKTYELTPTEAALSAMVCEGMTNVQIAETRGRAVDTVNAQVKSVLAKTGCNNRTQLVRLMTSFGTDFLVR